MGGYRVFFRNGPNIVGRHDFTADNDQAAVTTADVLCDACSDRCDSFEVWNRDHCVVGRTSRSQRAADVIMGRSQAAIVACEETIQQSEWVVARSEKLLGRLSELRGGSAHPQPPDPVKRDEEHSEVSQGQVETG